MKGHRLGCKTQSADMLTALGEPHKDNSDALTDAEQQVTLEGAMFREGSLGVGAERGLKTTTTKK